MEQAFTEFIPRFEQDTIDGLLVADVVEAFSARRTHMKTMYERYKMNGQYIPGMKRELPVKTVFNEKVVGDYIGQAIDIKVGYFSGVPIAYSYDKDMAESETATDKIYRFNRLNRMADLDSETVLFLLIR